MPSSGSSPASAPKAWLCSSPSASSVEMAPPRGPPSHGVISPVVAVVSSALAWRWPHHAWTSPSIESWSVVVRGRGVIKAKPSWGVIGWEATIHGHLHVHVQVVHGVHVWTVSQQTLVDWMKKNSDLRTKSKRCVRSVDADPYSEGHYLA